MNITYIVKKLETNHDISETEAYVMQDYLSNIMFSLDKFDEINDHFFELYNSCIKNFNSVESDDSEDFEIIQEFKYKTLRKLVDLHKLYITNLSCAVEGKINDNRD